MDRMPFLSSNLPNDSGRGRTARHSLTSYPGRTENKNAKMYVLNIRTNALEISIVNEQKRRTIYQPNGCQEKPVFQYITNACVEIENPAEDAGEFTTLRVCPPGPNQICWP